jgi:dihydroorotase
MSLHIANARLIDPATDMDIMGGLLIDGDQIFDLGEHLLKPGSAAERVLDAQGACLAPGLIDLRVKTGEPGEEHRETLATASRAAVAGGITSMVVMPDTSPVIDDMALVQFISNQGEKTALNRVYPAGALSTGLQGKAMSELGLMTNAGAVFFTNGDSPITDAGVLKRAMTYAAGRDMIVSSCPDEQQLSGHGVMNAGALAAQKGLKGISAEAELIGLQRDIALAEATGCHLLVDNISTAQSVDVIKRAKASGVKITVTIAAYSLFFNEIDVGDYLTYCKVNPPFRTEEDRLALIKAVADGTIDIVTSAHDPQPPENKRLPFGEASFGAAGLETLLSTLLALVQDEQLSLLEALRPLTSAPGQLLGLEQGTLRKGAPADLILFNPNKPWHCKREELLSRSVNSPYDGRRMVGQVSRTFVGGREVHRRT